MLRTFKAIFNLMILFLTTAFIVTFLSSSTLSTVRAATNITNNRLAGDERYQTAVKISQSGWKTTSKYAIIATGEDFPDALCAAPLARKHNAPILLTAQSNLNIYSGAELQRLQVTEVMIVGGTGAVSLNVENQIKALGIIVNRIAGTNRFETSVKIAEQLGTSNQVVIATGVDFPDALSISSIAASKGIPILLTQTNSIPDEIKPYLSSHNLNNSYIIGGQGVITDTVFNGLQNPKRISGSNRYETNIAVLKEFSTSLNLSNVYISTGNDFPDALATSALAPITSSPVILMGTTPEAPNINYIKSNLPLINSCTVIGGPSIIKTGIIDIALTLYKPIYAIDIGHNAAYDSGANGIRNEDIVNKEVGTLVISKLRALGYTAVNCNPTNAANTTDSLQQRCDIANAAKADYFMSIHFNIFNKKAQGSEVYTGSERIRGKANQVLSNLVNLGFTNRGVQGNPGNFYVLRNTNMPSMLVECAFLDSSSDMAKYDANKIADALVNGLIAGN